MAKTKDTRQDSGATDNVSADFSRVAAHMFGSTPIMPIHPLMAHPAAALAAVTAIGFGFTSQLAGAFLGAFQGAVEATSKLADALEDEKHQAKAQAAAKPPVGNAGAGNAQPAKAAPAAKPVAPKPVVVALKPVAAKQKPAAVKKTEPKPAVAASKAAAVPAKKVAKVEVAAPVAARTTPSRSRKAAEKADDLKRISGVGPKLEQVLNGRGIGRFADIAAWSDADIERIDAELGFDGRIRRDDWVGQARALLPKGRS